MKVRKSIVFDIELSLWRKFEDLVFELSSYNGRILVKMIEYVLENKEDFVKFVEESKKKEKAIANAKS